MFFCKERKRMQRMQCSYAKNVKERKERNILMQKNAKEGRMLHSFEKNAYPILVLFLNIYILFKIGLFCHFFENLLHVCYVMPTKSFYNSNICYVKNVKDTCCYTNLTGFGFLFSRLEDTVFL